MLILLGWGAALAGGGYDYFPLNEGWTWTYAMLDGGVVEAAIEGWVKFEGEMTIERLVEVTGPQAQIVHNYWTKDSEGNVFLHGAYNEDGFVAAYDPPIPFIDAPLYQGKTWLVSTDLNGEPILDYYYVVDYEGETIVTAGTFYGYRVKIDVPEKSLVTKNGASYDLLGFRRGDAETPDVPFGDTFVDGVGMVIGAFEGELISWQGPVATENSTWGDLKALYR
jgi:hypothetical protein